MASTAWLGVIYQQFRRELFVTAWTVLRKADLAEDAVQAAFAKLAQLRSPPADPQSYVFRCVQNAAIDLARARWRRCEEALPAGWDLPGDMLASQDAELSKLAAELLSHLDEASREVIELHLHAALTFDQIAKMLDEPLPTVASRYRRALAKLSEQLKVRHE